MVDRSIGLVAPATVLTPGTPMAFSMPQSRSLTVVSSEAGVMTPSPGAPTTPARL